MIRKIVSIFNVVKMKKALLLLIFGISPCVINRQTISNCNNALLVFAQISTHFTASTNAMASACDYIRMVIFLEKRFGITF